GRVMRAITGPSHSRTVTDLPQDAKRLSIARTVIPRSAEVHGAQNRRKPILPCLDSRVVFYTACDFLALNV
ncbi:hypothetical protein SB778_38895, partial [Paraburkholderia sp. SIMBA_050]